MKRAVILCIFAGCASWPEGAECPSLLGEPLFPPPLAPDVQARREAELAAARADFARDPGDVGAIVWLGRRTAYLGRYREAVAIYSEGLLRHPDAPELLRHRGHRFLTLREFAKAEEDLTRAAELVRGRADVIEPDGLPVPGRPPHSTLQFNIHYHLGLARWLQRDFAGAVSAWADCLEVANNDEARVAVCHWLWSGLQRVGDREWAPRVLMHIRADMDVVENVAYHRLCLLYRGELRPEEVSGAGGSSTAAARYGLGNWHWIRGERSAAVTVWRQLLERGEWTAFGHIAAEAELHAGPGTKKVTR